MADPPPTLRLEFRLAEADVRQYCSGGVARRWWDGCRGRKPALLLLVALGCFLVGTCFHAHGARAGGLATGTTFVVLAALAWDREARHDRQARRLARQMGLPREIRLVVSPDGIAEESDPALTGPGRTFAWSGVVEVSRVDHLTAIRVRPAGGVLIVPDSAFATPGSRGEFEEALRIHRSTRDQVGDGLG